MDSSRGFPTQQTWSAAQLEQLRKFLQTASQIPSTNTIQEALQPKATYFQLPIPGQSQKAVGTSCSNIPNTRSQTGSFRGLNLVPQPSHIVRANAAGSSVAPSPLIRPVPDGVTAMKYPTPDVNSMAFDPGTGYRFDQFTGLYYDANAGLFVNKQLNLLLQWNPVISTYALVGRASDVAAPALAQDLARLMGHGQPTVATSTLNTSKLTSTATPALKPPIPSSSQDSVRDAPSFRRERSLSFEEMSPERDEVVSHQAAHTSPSKRQSPGLSKYDEGDLKERRRSLSFDEMTPERDTDDFSGVSVFPRENRSPSYDRKREMSSRSRRTDFRVSPDMRYSPHMDSSLGHSTSRDLRERSPRWDYSRSPSPRLSHRRLSPTDRSRRSSPERWLSPRRGSRLSPSPLRSQNRRPSPDYNRGNSPERGTRRRSSPSRAPRRRLSPGISRDSKERRDESGGGRFRRSPSPTYQFGRRKKNDHTKRGQTSRDSRRSRSRNRSTASRNNPTRSTSRSGTNVNQQSKSSVQSRGSRSPSDGKNKAPQSEPKQAQSKNMDESCDSGPPSHRKNSAFTEGSSQAGGAAKAGQLPLIPGFVTGFSDSFMAKNILRIHKNNLRNPGNIYGRIFPPHPVHTLFIMLTPLPHKGDREWKDLEILLSGMIEAEGIGFLSVRVYPGDGGAPCNYCLIRFKDPENAFRWYMVHEGAIDLSGPDGSTCTVFMNFIQNNWKCKKCKESNFALRHFCHKCFWFITSSKTPIQVSQLVTKYVGIAGLDCRFLSMEEVLIGLPPLDSFNVETFELLAEPTGIPVGLCVFKFEEQQESAAFYRFLQESCLNPIFVDIVDRVGLGVNAVKGQILKNLHASSRCTSSKSAVPAKELAAGVPVTEIEVPTVMFANPPEVDPKNNPLLWWRFVAGYVSEEGGDMMKYLFEEHPDVNIPFESAPAQIMLGPLPIPLACDLMEYRDLFCRFLQTTGITSKNAEKIAICRAHHFGAPYNYSLIRFDNKIQTKEWFEKNDGKTVLNLENGSTWPVYIHYSKPNWQCGSCHKLNFPLRIQCFSCYKPRLTDHTPVSFKKNPTNFIGITGYQNWCATEELLFKKLPFLRTIENLTINYLKEPTGVPLGICVLKSATSAASKVLFNKLQDALSDEIAKATILEPNRPLLVYIV